MLILSGAHLRSDGREDFGTRKTAHLRYVEQSPAEQRRLLEVVLWNCTFDRGTLSPTYTKPFDLFVAGNESGGLSERVGFGLSALHWNQQLADSTIPRMPGMPSLPWGLARFYPLVPSSLRLPDLLLERFGFGNALSAPRQQSGGWAWFHTAQAAVSG